MSKVLVIGCGGVASVAISKCCQVSDVFTELCIASRTKSKCDAPVSYTHLSSPASAWWTCMMTFMAINRCSWQRC